MKMTKQKLKILVEALILKEGQVEDLLAKEPDLQAAINLGIRNPSQLKWLVRMKKFEPIADMVGLISAFEQNKQRLAVKDLDAYHNPNDLRSALEALGESEGDKRRKLREGETDIIYEDEKWLVVMPHTMESSIQWGKGTTWCTSATQSANFFYTIVGRNDEDIVLYYIIRKGADSKLDPNAKLSVGFVDGTPLLDGARGGLSVNVLNSGLTESSLKEILGSTKFELIMKAMRSHLEKIRGKHPAKKVMQKIAISKDSRMFDKYTEGMNEDQRKNFINILFEYDNISVELLTILASDPDARANIADHPSTPIEILTSFASDPDENVRQGVASNHNTTPETLALLASDESVNVRREVARNQNTASETLALLASDEDEQLKTEVAYNPNTPIEILALLASDNHVWVRTSLAQNPNTPIQILNRLASDKHKDVRAAIANNQEYQNYLESQGQLLERWIKLAGLLN